MIAQVVFDLPLDKHFDYFIPSSLEQSICSGMRVQALFNSRKHIGLVTGLINHSDFEELESIKLVVDEQAILDQSQMDLGVELSRYYGCSLGEALFTIIRSCEKQKMGVSIKREKSTAKLYVISSGHYGPLVLSLLKPIIQEKKRVLILVPDQFIQTSVENFLKKYFSKEEYVIGTRSMVFRSLADIALVIMVDEDNSSYKQEQTPMYETRDVLWMRFKKESVDVAFVSTTPTVEMMELVNKEKIELQEHPAKDLVKSQIVDLNNYRIMIKGILSPAVLSALESNIIKKLKSIVVFNHLGSYAMTRCSQCEFVLKCQKCHSPMVYSRTRKEYHCRYCAFHLPEETVCPTCKKPSWKSFGLGIEQLQKSLLEKYPNARIAIFEKNTKDNIQDYDILIGTWALLRLKNHTKVQSVIFLDMDSELNRLDMRSCFRAWSMVGHLRVMAQGQILIQSRQIDHYVIQALAQDKSDVFYREDMKIRRELGFSPFSHQVTLGLRSTDTEFAEKTAKELYQVLKRTCLEGIQIHTPVQEAIVNKRGKHRLNILVQGRDVIAMIALIKEAMSKIKRNAKVIITINVDS